MTLPVITGQSLLDKIINRMGGYANAESQNVLLDFLNEGKDELWAILRTLGQDYFTVPSQAATSTDDDFFVALSTNTREYNLPPNCREVRMVEVTTPGFEEIKFVQHKLTDPEFTQTRRLATASGTGSGAVGTQSNYLFTVIGRRTFMLAQFPETALSVKLWYDKALDDLDVTSVLSDILHPFANKLVSFAVQRAMLAVQDEAMSAEWLNAWHEDIKSVAMGAMPRASVSPVFVADFEG